MKIRTLLVAGTALCLLAFFAGCSKAPKAEIDAANAALDSAKAAEADVYSADQYNAAKSSLETALAEVKSQNSKFALARNYEPIKKLLQQVIADATAAKEAAAGNKQNIKGKASDAIKQATAAVDEAKKLVAKMKKPKKKDAKAADAVKAKLKDAESTLAQAQAALKSGDLFGAQNSGVAALDKANALKSELQPAKAEKKSKKKK